MIRHINHDHNMRAADVVFVAVIHFINQITQQVAGIRQIGDQRRHQVRQMVLHPARHRQIRRVEIARLVPQVVDAVKVPVIAAGGFFENLINVLSHWGEGA